MDEIRKKMELLLLQQLNKLSSNYPLRSIYCWRKYLFRIGGFKTIDRDTLLDNMNLFSNYVVFSNPAFKSTSFYLPRFGKEEFVVVDKVFALKCLTLGIPEISSMKFKMPKDWNSNDHNPNLRFDLSDARISAS